MFSVLDIVGNTLWIFNKLRDLLQRNSANKKL